MTKVARTNDRVLLAELDSTQQKVGMCSTGWLLDFESNESAILKQALAKLRLEALLSERIVITDAQALDGRIILGLASSGLLKKLQTDPEQPLPIELRARESTIEATISSIYQPKCADKGFQSSFLSEGDRVAYAMAQLVFKKVQLRSLSEVRSFLERSGARGDELQALAEGWVKITELTDSKLLPLRSWAESRAWGEAVELSAQFLPLSALAATFAEDETEYAAMQELGAETNRSMFLNGVDQWNGRDETAEVLKFWFDERYNRAIAFQHSADFRSIHTGVLGRIYFRELDQSVGRHRRTRVQLPAGFLDRLGDLTTLEWQTGYAQVKNMIRPWWKEGDTGSLQRSLDSLVALWGPSEATQPRGHLFARVISFGFNLGAPATALMLSPNPLGVSVTLLLELGALATQWLAAPGPEQKCAVTDYLDDVATA